MKSNISSKVVTQGKCIGCGTCVAICPANVLTMKFNNSGSYYPHERVGCLEGCKHCLMVCPFGPQNVHEMCLSQERYSHISGIRHHKELGYFLNTYEIHKKNTSERLKSASGGAGHWLLSTLLDKHYVDHVVTVEPYDDPKKLFKFSVFDSPNELNGSQGSVYYPTELSEVLEHIMVNDGRYAITVLPCFAKAIRLAQKNNAKLQKRIVYLIGLVCGQLKTKEFTRELGQIATGADMLSRVRYRVKNAEQTANNFTFEFITTDGINGKCEWSAQPNFFWRNRMFTPTACNYCSDTFALSADVVLMDAWLPEYSKDFRGHSLAIVRSDKLNTLLTSSDQIAVKHVSEKCVYDSQRNLAYIKKAFTKGNFNPIMQGIVSRKKQIQALSHRHNWKTYNYQIQEISTQIKNLEKINRIITLPKRAFLKFIRDLKG